MKNYIIFIAGLLVSSCTIAVSEEELLFTENIRINQIGYYPSAPKIAVVKGDVGANEFYILSADLKDTVLIGQLSERRTSPYSGASTRIIDFSALTLQGDFVIIIPDLGKSGPVIIKEKVHLDLAKASAKSYYFQRVSIELTPEYASKWARQAGHADTQVFIHASAASEQRSEGTVISAPGGWYDAGDYNKYIVNSGITMGTIFSLYEDHREFVDNMNLNIPESENALSDLLDEALYNLRWMLAMQDPGDGGVYHKLTTAEFEGMMIKPAEAKNRRYVVQKSTEATLDFAAVMAQSSRIFREFDRYTPGLADSCLNAAVMAWEWAKANPKKHYDQDANNKIFEPAVRTGAYGDKKAEDEFLWAAVELWATTGNEGYLSFADLRLDEPMEVPSWPNVSTLGYYTLLRFKDKLQNKALANQVKGKLITLAEKLIKNVDSSPYNTVMGGRTKDFVWGSNAVAANQGIVLLNAFQESGEQKYVDYALVNLDYLMGRNATGYSFVTGYGFRSPKFIHHRPSESDDVEEPVPGLLAGGPNPGQQDKCDYPYDAADESYIDHSCSYASNEIAINWNAPLVYIATAIEAMQYKIGYSKRQKL